MWTTSQPTHYIRARVYNLMAPTLLLPRPHLQMQWLGLQHGNSGGHKHSVRHSSSCGTHRDKLVTELEREEEGRVRDDKFLTKNAEGAGLWAEQLELQQIGSIWKASRKSWMVLRRGAGPWGRQPQSQGIQSLKEVWKVKREAALTRWESLFTQPSQMK